MNALRAVRKGAAAIAVAAMGLASSPAVHSAVLLSETFTGTIMQYGQTINLKDNPGNTANDNLNRWIDSSAIRWAIQSGGICASPCAGAFAQHLVQTSDNTNILFYGLSGAGLGAGTELELGFDFISSNRNGRAYLVGMNFGQHAFDPNGPWLGEGVPPDTDDGVVLDSLSLRSRAWTQGSITHTLAQPYDVLVVAFAMGGTGGDRGIDNVRLSTVPEPGTLALLGLGLAGLAAARRRRG